MEVVVASMETVETESGESLPNTTALLLHAIAEDDFGLMRGPDVPSNIAKWACDAYLAAGGEDLVHNRGQGLPEDYYVIKVGGTHRSHLWRTDGWVGPTAPTFVRVGRRPRPASRAVFPLGSTSSPRCFACGWCPSAGLARVYRSRGRRIARGSR